MAEDIEFEREDGEATPKKVSVAVEGGGDGNLDSSDEFSEDGQSADSPDAEEGNGQPTETPKGEDKPNADDKSGQPTETPEEKENSNPNDENGQPTDAPIGGDDTDATSGSGQPSDVPEGSDDKSKGGEGTEDGDGKGQGDEEGEKQKDDTFKCVVIGVNANYGQVGKIISPLTYANLVNVEFEYVDENGTTSKQTQYIRLDELLLVGDQVMMRQKFEGEDNPNEQILKRCGLVLEIIDGQEGIQLRVLVFKAIFDPILDRSGEEMLVPVIQSESGSVGILYKNPNCAIVGKGERDDIGLFIEEDVDDSGRNIVLIKTERNSYAVLPSAIKRTDIITFLDEVKVTKDAEIINGRIADSTRYFSFGYPISGAEESRNYASVDFLGKDKSVERQEWVRISNIDRLYGGVPFKSTTVQIINQIIEDFSKKGVLPHEKDDFLYCHLTPSLFQAVMTILKAEGKDEEYLMKEFDSTFKQMEAVDEQIAKTLLSYMMTNGNLFDPQTAYGVLLYNALNDLGVFAMDNTEIEATEGVVMSVFTRGDSVFVYQELYANKFFYEIMFGESKNIIKFALWKDYKSEKIEELYSFLQFLKLAKERRENTPTAVRFPEYNEKIGNLYLLQLKALENAI